MEKIRILLTYGHYPDVHAVKSFLQQSRDPEYEVYNFVDPDEALSFLADNAVDVILSSSGRSSAYNDVLDFIRAARIIAVHTPVIVFSGDLERQRIDEIIAAGAVNIISRERSLNQPEDLRTAIAYALLRHDKSSHNLKAAVSLARSGCQSKEHAADFARLERERTAEANDYRQTYFWMHGGYSMEKPPEKAGKDDTGSLEQKQNAIRLKEAQTGAARHLLQSQKAAADKLRASNALAAAALKRAQEKTAADLKTRHDEIELCQCWLDIEE